MAITHNPMWRADLKHLNLKEPGSSRMLFFSIVTLLDLLVDFFLSIFQVYCIFLYL